MDSCLLICFGWGGYGDHKNIVEVEEPNFSESDSTICSNQSAIFTVSPMDVPI